MFGTCVLFPSGYLSVCLDLCISHYTWSGGFCVQPVLESLTWQNPTHESDVFDSKNHTRPRIPTKVLQEV